MFERRDGHMICDGHITLLPGFVDLHVHFREPGFSAKETVASGSKAALRGGYAAVCAMPNLNPPPDTPAHLQIELDIIKRDALLPVFPVGCITMGQKGEGTLSEIEKLAPHVCGFSDDGVGVRDGRLMREAMERARACGKPILSHCEDKSLGDGPASEWVPLARDLELARQTGCHYHVCHVSTKESVELIRKAKQDGAPVTAETAPHYLLLTEDDREDDGRFRMNPPLRSEGDRAALLRGLLDGTIDCVATDHAPHTREEKSRGFAGSACGIVGLETAFPVLYTKLVRTGMMTLEMLVERMSDTPRRLLESWTGGKIEGTCAWDLEKKYVIDPKFFKSKGESTPFAGWEVYGECREWKIKNWPERDGIAPTEMSRLFDMDEERKPLLQRIRERPGMYLGKVSLTAFGHFMNGYAFRNYEPRDPVPPFPDSGLYEYIVEKYNLSRSYYNAIGHCLNLCDGDDEAAFWKYFELLDEYTEVNGCT